MIVEVNVEKLLDYGIDWNQYMFLQFIYQQQQAMFDTYIGNFDKFYTKDSLDELKDLGYLGLNEEKLGYRFNNMVVTSKFIEHFIEKAFISKVAKERVEDWIDEWYELWPKGVKSGGSTLVRSDKNGCLNKMKKFIKVNPQFTKDIIIRATKDYLAHLRMSNYAFIQAAHYYIFKNDVSNLASACEDIKDKLENSEDYNLYSDETIDRFIKRLNDGD